MELNKSGMLTCESLSLSLAVSPSLLATPGDLSATCTLPAGLLQCLHPRQYPGVENVMCV